MSHRSVACQRVGGELKDQLNMTQPVMYSSELYYRYERGHVYLLKFDVSIALVAVDLKQIFMWVLVGGWVGG